MQKNTVLTKILADFLAAHGESNIDALREFCDYAEDWFRDAGVVGLGFTADGMALRFSDAQELLFFSPALYSFDVGAGVQISGNNKQKNVKMPEPVSSFQITGQ